MNTAALSTRPADEALRVLANTRHTHYQHTIYIDEATGTYDLDCSGFVSYLLGNVAPRHLGSITKPDTRMRLLAVDYCRFFAALSATAIAGWQAVDRLSDAARGDIVTWALTPPHHDSGHIFVIADTPSSVGANVVAVPAYDASEDPALRRLPWHRPGPSMKLTCWLPSPSATTTAGAAVAAARVAGADQVADGDQVVTVGLEHRDELGDEIDGAGVGVVQQDHRARFDLGHQASSGWRRYSRR
jgi:hypothetical protein